jgi:EpsI family protein
MSSLVQRAIALCLVLGATTIYIASNQRVEAAVTREVFASFPMTIGNWQGVVDPPLEKSILDVLGVDDYLSRVYYRSDGRPVGLYMGFYASQRQGDTIHSPLNCLPGAGWEAVSEGRLTIPNVDGNGRDITVNRYVVQKGLDRHMVLYWYQSQGRVIASEYTSKIYLIHDAVRMNRSDGSMVRVISPIDPRLNDDGAAAQELAQQFVRAVFPHLGPYLGQ